MEASRVLTSGAWASRPVSSSALGDFQLAEIPNLAA